MEEYKGFFKTVDGNAKHCAYKTRLDMYGCGCAHNCNYCYARSLLSIRNLWDPQHPRVADEHKLQQVISHRLKPGDCVRLGGMTDCLQPLEREFHLTKKVIGWLNERRVHYMLITKSDLIAEDEYRSLLDHDLAHIQMSITTSDDDIARSYEHCTLPSARIHAAERLQNDGFDVTLRLSPMVPQLVDYDVVNQIAVDKLLVGFYFVSPQMQRWMPVDYSVFTHKEAGYLHLPLATKIECMSHFTGFRQVSVCEDCPSHYPYWRDHFNPNPQDCCNLQMPAKPQQRTLFGV